MSHGVKLALIAGIVLVGGYLVLGGSSSASSLLPTGTPAGLPLTPAPGAAAPPSTLSTVNSAVQGGASAITRTALVTGGQTALAIATGGVSLLATTSTGRSVVKGVAGGVATAAKDVGSAVGSAASSTYHAIASIF